MKQEAFKKEKMAKLCEISFGVIAFCATFLPIGILAWLLMDTFIKGWPRISLQFLISYPSRFPFKAGILPSLLGSVYLLVLTSLIAIPLAISSAVYLEEYAKDSWLKKVIELNVSNLAGVPSVIFGLLGLKIFVQFCGLGASLLAGALTLSLLILPVIITSTREALRMVPNSFREAGLALGTSKFFVVIKIILPLAWPQIITGTILAISRALGESAPLIIIGGATYLAFVPNSVMSQFSALPLQIFNWVQRPQPGFIDNAASAIIVLLFILIIFNGLAAWLRQRYEKKRGNS